MTRIASECGADFSSKKYLSKTLVKKHMRYFPIPEGELWRSPLLRDLIKAKHDISTLPGFSHAEVEDLLKNVCTS